MCHRPYVWQSAEIPITNSICVDQVGDRERESTPSGNHVEVLKRTRIEMGQTLGLYRVDQSIVAVKEKWGRFVDIVGPGCHCVPWCVGVKISGVLSLRLQQLVIHCVTKTKISLAVLSNIGLIGEVRMVCDCGRLYSREYLRDGGCFSPVSSIRRDSRRCLLQANESLRANQGLRLRFVRASVPLMLLDDVFEQKNDIANSVKEELEKAMRTFGYEIVKILIVDIEPDQTIKRAMNEINAAARRRLVKLDKAEAEKILQVKRAEGEAESNYLSGMGVARQRQAIVDGMRDSVLAFSHIVPETSPNEVMDMVLVTQYFDTVRDIGVNSKDSTVSIPHGVGGAGDVADQIRSGLLPVVASNRAHAH